MTPVQLQQSAALRLDEIFRYTRDRWGQAQAERYISGLFESFGKIETREIFSKPVPADFGVNGFYYRYEHHFVYWRRLKNGEIGIVTILHERMHQIDRFLGEPGP